MIANSDTALGIASYFNLIKSAYVWNPLSNYGAHTFGYELYGYLPQFFFEKLFGYSYASYLGLLLTIIGFFIVTLLIVLSLSNRFLNRKLNAFKAVLFSLFFITNPLFLYFSIVNQTLLLGYLFMYISLCLFCIGIYKKNYVFALLSSVLISFSIMDFHSLVLFSVVVGFVLFMIFVASRESRDFIIKYALTLFFSVFLLNAHWIFYNLYLVFGGSGVPVSSNVSESINQAVLGTVNKTNVLWKNAVIDIDKYTFYTPAFLRWSLLIVSILTAMFCVYTILFYKPESKKRVISWSVLTIAYVFLTFMSFGPKEPTGIFEKLFSTSSVFQLFREFYKFHRITLVLQLILLVIGYSNLLSGVKRKVFVAIVVVGVLLRGANAYYAFQYINKYEIPVSYSELAQGRSSGDADYRTLVLPQIGWFNQYVWSNQRYDMQDPLTYLYPYPLLLNSISYKPDKQELYNYKIADLLLKKDYTRVVPLLKESRIKYILIRKDINESNISKLVKLAHRPTNSYYASSYVDAVSNLVSAKKIHDTQYFTMYELNYYAPTSSLLYSGGASLPYRRLSPSAYVVALRADASRLLLNYNFDPNWAAVEIDSTTSYGCNSSADTLSLHEKLCSLKIPYLKILQNATFSSKEKLTDYTNNSFDAALLIDQPDKNTKVLVYYVPQAFFDFGLFISLTTLVTISLIFIFNVPKIVRYVGSRPN